MKSTSRCAVHARLLHSILLAMIVMETIIPLTRAEGTISTKEAFNSTHKIPSPQSLRTARDLSKKHNDMNFDQPMEDWPAEQWMDVGVLIFLAFIALCILCNLIQCVLGCLCACLGCTPSRSIRYGNRNEYYYDASAPLIYDNNHYQQPPAYNPEYRNDNSRSIRGPEERSYNYTDNSGGGGGGGDCSLLDCVAAFCCLQCCSQNRFSLRDIVCGLCCFEFCCRGGRDVLGNNGVGKGYGSFAVI